MSALLDAAVDYARAGWPVFPAVPRGKVPLIPRWEGGRGHLDGTTDPAQVGPWWAQWPNANVASRVPDSVVVVDEDPRNGAEDTLTALADAGKTLPPTLEQRTPSGGCHLFFLHPGGRLMQSAHKLGPGLDVKLGGKGYVLLEPSIGANGRGYRWVDPSVPVAAMPAWMVAALRPPAPRVPPLRSFGCGADGRPGDTFNATARWEEVLAPHGWRVHRQRGEVTDWTRPGKDGGTSATTNALGTDRLHIFTSSALPLICGESYSKFGAWATLEHGGDFAAAARSLRVAS